MRALLFSLVIIAVSSSIALAQNYKLEFHSDETLSSCELAVNTPGLIKVHMVVTGQGTLAGVIFKAPKPACMRSAVWVGDVWQQPRVGGAARTTQDPNGVDVLVPCSLDAPNQPPYLPVYLGWIWYSVTEPTDPCCNYVAAATPGHSTPIIVLCSDFIDRPMGVAKIVMNPNNTCRCDPPLATESTTWGAVKALYR